jgi:hypothetical protein
VRGQEADRIDEARHAGKSHGKCPALAVVEDHAAF